MLFLCVGATGISVNRLGCEVDVAAGIPGLEPRHNPAVSMRPTEAQSPVPSRASVTGPDANPAGKPGAEPGSEGSPDAEQHDGHGHPPANPVGKRLAILTLTALGVVYGDIGTSPLYTMRETFSPEYGMTPNPANVYGILCLVFWSIMLVVVFKYLIFILRADNRGEGGVLAMLALLLQKQQRTEDRRRRAILIILGVFGTALLFGERTPTMLASFYTSAVVLIAAAGFMAGGGIIFTFGIVAFAAHLAWQVNRLDIDDPAHCLVLFRSNRDAGLILFAAMLLDATA